MKKKQLGLVDPGSLTAYVVVGFAILWGVAFSAVEAVNDCSSDPAVAGPDADPTVCEELAELPKPPSIQPVR